MKQIYKSKHFGHLDLSKIISISNSKLSSGGQYVEFTMLIQLRSEPLTYSRGLKYDTEQRWVMPEQENYCHWEIKTVDGEWKRNIKINTDHDTTVAEFNLQSEINELVSAWKSYCTAYEVANYPREPGSVLPPI